MLGVVSLEGRLMTKREKILAVVGRINELRAELARAEAEFAALVPEDDDAAPRAGSEPYTDGGDRLPARILSVLNSKPDRSFAAPELVTALGIEPAKIDQVRATLFRLKRATKIRKVRKGKYRALTQPKVEMTVIRSVESHAVAG